MCFYETSVNSYKPTSLLLNWLPGVFPLDAKRPGRECDQSPQHSAEFKNEGRCISALPYAFKFVLLLF